MTMSKHNSVTTKEDS